MKLTERLGIRYPVLLAPMAQIAGGRLADVARNCHCIGSLISSCVHQPSGSWRGLVDDGQNGPCDKVAFLIQSERNHRLNIQDPSEFSF